MFDVTRRDFLAGSAAALAALGEREGRPAQIGEADPVAGGVYFYQGDIAGKGHCNNGWIVAEPAPLPYGPAANGADRGEAGKKRSAARRVNRSDQHPAFSLARQSAGHRALVGRLRTGRGVRQICR